MTPAKLLRDLTIPTTKGGLQAEEQYREWHKLRRTQKLKRKYTRGNR